MSAIASEMPLPSPAPAQASPLPWRALLKAGAVLAGYAIAFVVASIAVYVRQLTTQGPDAQASSGMYAFGDAILFFAVFGMLGLVPTGLALYFLRPVRLFWTCLAIALLSISATGPLAVMSVILGSSGAGAPSIWTAWAAFSVLRILPAPIFAATYLLCGCFAPTRFARWAIFAATVVEGCVALFGFFHWFVAPSLH